MTLIPTKDLRAVRDTDKVPPLPLAGDGFRLELRETLIHVPTNRPYYAFNIVASEGRAAGRIQILLEPDGKKVEQTGQICGFVTGKWRDGDLLARAVKALLPFAASHGFKEAWIVVPSEDEFSMRTCSQAGGRRDKEFRIGNVPHTRFVVPVPAP